MSDHCKNCGACRFPDICACCGACRHCGQVHPQPRSPIHSPPWPWRPWWADGPWYSRPIGTTTDEVKITWSGSGTNVPNTATAFAANVRAEVDGLMRQADEDDRRFYGTYATTSADDDKLKGFRVQ